MSDSALDNFNSLYYIDLSPPARPHCTVTLFARLRG